MGLLNEAPLRPAGITCEKWRPHKPGAKRCAHYNDNGTCQLPDELMCVEWEKANAKAAAPSLDPLTQGSPAPVASPPAQAPLTPEGVTQLALTPAARPEGARGARHLPMTGGTVTVLGPPAYEAVKEISASSVEALELLGIELKLHSPDLTDDVWLVPKLTGSQDRFELTFRDAATIRLIVDAFPGSRVVELRPKGKIT